MKNPTQKHRAAMSQLFPSSSTVPKRPRLSDAFDPTLQCVAFNQQRKKKAVRAKITMMLVPNGSKVVPRGKHRKSLMQNKIEIYRTMSALEVKRTIRNSFTSLQASSFVYLRVDAAQKFSNDTTQDKDGNAMADCGRHGNIYIKEQTDVSITRV